MQCAAGSGMHTCADEAAGLITGARIEARARVLALQGMCRRHHLHGRALLRMQAGILAPIAFGAMKVDGV